MGYTETDLGQLHYRRTGAGSPIVLLPAASQSHNQLLALAGCLAAAHEVTILDLFGSGYSAPLPEGVSFPSLAEALAQAAASLCAGPVVFYGIHTGNKLATAIAARHPDLVRGLVLCGQTHSLIVGKVARETQMRRVSAHRFVSSAHDPAFARLRDRLSLWRELEAVWFDGVVMSGRDEPGSKAGTYAFIADLLLSSESLPALYEANFRYDLEADLRRVTAPTLVVEIATPHEDREIGRQAAAVTGVIPGSRSIVFEEPDGLGLTLENRAVDLARAIIDFAASLAPPVGPARASEGFS